MSSSSSSSGATSCIAPRDDGQAQQAIPIIAPDEDGRAKDLVSVFLAGSIAMGSAPNWQEKITPMLSHLPIAIYNPRRGGEFKWDEKDTDIINQQIEWEHKHLDASSIIAMFLSEKSPAPISLLELGLFARTRKLIVCCEKDFYRLGLVKRVCEDHQIMLVHEVEDLAKEVEKKATEIIDSGTSTVKKGQEDTRAQEELRHEIFLAGSISGGEPPEWQKGITEMLSDVLSIAELGPGRSSELEQRLDHVVQTEIEVEREIDGKMGIRRENKIRTDIYDATFKEQFDWENKYLWNSSIIAMFLSDKNQMKEGPIILLELGLLAATRTPRLIVLCEDFYRTPNVQWVCKEYKITMVRTREDLVKKVNERAKEIKSGRKD